MKKFFSFALCAVTLVALTGCPSKPDDPGKKPQTDGVTITVSPKSLSLSIEDQERLRAIVTPEGTTLNLKWESSDPAVATVTSAGLVTAVAEGKANIIVSAEGVKGDTCVVEVSDMAILDAYTIEDYGVFGTAALSFVENSDTILEFSIGSFNCKIGYWPLLAWDGNLTYVDGTGLTGAGFLTYGKAPFYTIVDENAGEYNGIPVSWGSFWITDTQGLVVAGLGEAGKVDKDKYCEYMDSYVEEIKNDGDGSNIKWSLFSEAISGMMVFVADYTAEDPVWYVDDYGLVSALVKDLQVAYDGNTESFQFAADLDWFDFISDDAYYGLVLSDPENYVVKKPYELRMISRHYGEDAIYAAPAKKQAEIIGKYHKQMPALPVKAHKLPTDKFIRK